MQFEVADYTYLVLKIPGPTREITLHGDAKRAYECDRESCDMADIMAASLKLAKELQSATESPQESVAHLQVGEAGDVD